MTIIHFIANAFLIIGAIFMVISIFATFLVLRWWIRHITEPDEVDLPTETEITDAEHEYKAKFIEWIRHQGNSAMVEARLADLARRHSPIETEIADALARDLPPNKRAKFV